MTVKTSKGKTFTIDWMWAPYGPNDDLVFEYSDNRSISAIAKEFEGVSHFHRESETEGNKDWYGYTSIRAIQRVKNDKVRLTLMQDKE